MDVPDLYSAIVEQPVPDGLSEVVHLEEIYKKWQHQQQEQCRLLETIRDLAEENKRILKERDELRDECDSLKKSNSVYKKNAQLIYTVCRCEINKRERKVATLERKLSSKHPECEIRNFLPSDHDDEYYGKMPLNLDTELKYTGILTELNNDTIAANHYSKDVHGKMSHYPSSSRDTPFDCRPFRGPKTPPTPNCGKGIASKTRPVASEQLDRKRVARPSWDDHYDSRSKYCRYDDYESTGDYYDKEKRSGSRMDYRRSYSSERKYDRRDGYSNDSIRSNYSRHKRDDERDAHHSNNRLSYSQSSRHSDRDKNYDETCYDRSRSSEDHYRHEWNGNDYRRSRDTYSRDVSRDRQRKSLDYEEMDGYHDNRSRYSRRNYDYDMESTSQDLTEGHRSRKYHDNAYHSKSVERYRDDESASGRTERHRDESRERFRPVNGRSHFDMRFEKRAANDIDSRSCSSSSHADRSLDRSQEDVVESSGNIDSNFSSSARADCAPDSSHPKRDNLRHEFDVKESTRRTVTTPLSPSSSSSPSQVESASEDEASIAVAATDCDDGVESSRLPVVEAEPKRRVSEPEQKRRVVEPEPKRRLAEPEMKIKPQEPVVEVKCIETVPKQPATTPDNVTSPESKKKLENCSLTAAETKLRKLKESKPILFTKVKDTPKNEEIDYIKTSLEASFRHDVAHFTSKQIHINTSVKEGHPPDEFAVLEGLRIQKVEEEAAKEDNFVLGTEYRKPKNDHNANAPTESVYSQRMREKLLREEEAEEAAKNVPIKSCPEPKLEPEPEQEEEQEMEQETEQETEEDMEPEPELDIEPEPDLESPHEEQNQEEEADINESPRSPCAADDDDDDDDAEPVSAPMEEVVEEEFDVTDNLVTDLKSPEYEEKIASPEVPPIDDRNAEMLPIEPSLSNPDATPVNSSVGSESLPDGIETYDVKSPEESQTSVVELRENDKRAKKAKKIEKATKVPPGNDPPPETLEWDCEVDLHLEEVDTTNVAAEAEELLSPEQEEDGEEEGLAGEVEEGEILDDSELEGSNGAEKTVKKKKRSRRAKAKPKAKEKWKGKKGQKSKKIRIGKEIASGRRETEPVAKPGTQPSRHVSPEHQTVNPSKIDLRSRDKKLSRPGHHDVEIGSRASPAFAPNRRRGGGGVAAEKFAASGAKNERRAAAIDRSSRSQAATATSHRRETAKEAKRFRGRGADESSATYRSLSPPPRGGATQTSSKGRHYEVAEHRFRRK